MTPIIVVIFVKFLELKIKLQFEKEEQGIESFKVSVTSLVVKKQHSLSETKI
jgi:hypothetical protein